MITAFVADVQKHSHTTQKSSLNLNDRVQLFKTARSHRSHLVGPDLDTSVVVDRFPPMQRSISGLSTAKQRKDRQTLVLPTNQQAIWPEGMWLRFLGVFPFYLSLSQKPQRKNRVNMIINKYPIILRFNNSITYTKTKANVNKLKASKQKKKKHDKWGINFQVIEANKKHQLNNKIPKLHFSKWFQFVRECVPLK